MLPNALPVLIRPLDEYDLSCKYVSYKLNIINKYIYSFFNSTASSPVNFTYDVGYHFCNLFLQGSFPVQYDTLEMGVIFFIPFSDVVNQK